MAALVRDWLSVVFAAIFLMVAGVTYWQNGKADFVFASVFATLGAMLAGVRIYFLWKPELARLKREQALLAAERRERAEEEFEKGCGEVAEAMSHLSLADLSVFITCQRFLDKGEKTYAFRTAQGSPVHDVLVRMCDVRCARPVEMKRIHPDYDASHCTYELTNVGIVLLDPMLRDSARRRRSRSERAGPART